MSTGARDLQPAERQAHLPPHREELAASTIPGRYASFHLPSEDKQQQWGKLDKDDMPSMMWSSRGSDRLGRIAAGPLYDSEAFASTQVKSRASRNPTPWRLSPRKGFAGAPDGSTLVTTKQDGRNERALSTLRSPFFFPNRPLNTPESCPDRNKERAKSHGQSSHHLRHNPERR